MKLLFLIATCERPQMLKRLLDQIFTQSPHSFTVCVVDDASEKDYSAVRQFVKATGGTYHRQGIRQGKRGYYKTVDRLFQLAEGYEFDYVYKLDDDVQLHPSAIERSLEIIQRLDGQHQKTVLNLWVDHRAEEAVWTGVVPRQVRIGGRELRRIGWIDGGNWMANHKVLEVLGWGCPQPPEKWWKTAGDSSGVGKFLSIELCRKACRVYMPMESLVFHGSHDSVMHPDKINRPIEMKEKPWAHE